MKISIAHVNRIRSNYELQNARADLKMRATRGLAKMRIIQMDWLKLCSIATFGCYLLVDNMAIAADHGDAPLMASDMGVDIADTYFFMDPNDRSRVTIIQTQRGFIVPGESENLTVFDPQINYRLAIENTGDASSDINFNVRFSPKTGFLDPQTATVNVTGITLTPMVMTAQTTVSSATLTIAPEPVITTDPRTGIKFFAGMTDDPFFFDVSAELLYRDSRIANQINPDVFDRGRDTFAGYNVLAIALSVPVHLLLGSNAPEIAFSGYTERAAMTLRSRADGLVDSGDFIVIDRMGIPAINTVLVPYEKKDAYNRSTTSLDPPGSSNPLGSLFVDDIVQSLQDLQTGTEAINLLAALAVNRGDYLRLDTSILNRGRFGGNNDGAGFPNGRRLRDDVIDTIVTIINNFEPVRPNGKVDRVNSNDKRLRNTFPFLASPHQPLRHNVVDPTEN